VKNAVSSAVECVVIEILLIRLAHAFHALRDVSFDFASAVVAVRMPDNRDPIRVIHGYGGSATPRDRGLGGLSRATGSGETYCPYPRGYGRYEAWQPKWTNVSAPKASDLSKQS
jgi:hypothetical protein